MNNVNEKQAAMCDVSMQTNKIKILIIKLGAIGDLVMLTPALRSLRLAHPSARISLLAGEEYKDVIEGNPNIDYLIIASGFKRGRRNYTNVLKLLSEIRKESFDIVINCHTTKLMNMFSFLTGAKERIGFDINGGQLNTKRVSYGRLRDKHDAEKYLELVKLAGGGPVPIEYQFYVPKECQAAVDEKLEELGLSRKKLVGFVVGGGGDSIFHLNRRWPTQNWIELSNLMRRKHPNVKIVLIGDKRDHELGERVRIATSNTVNLCGELNIKAVAALMRKLKVLVTTDTGPMHIGAALTRVVALFGPTSPNQFGPQPAKRHVTITSGMECSPCYKNERYKACYDNKCMKAITVESVYKEVCKILKKV